ncbi:isoleucine--tRNA ligase [Mucilaginibacter rubeus]|uniref:Isoleucine--tRNA ligase n=1 Tax=Mucilaginibacter rubeus TaxID=2027860 RepID=A0AAE6MKK9_9SPHI|nr:MULTISPECIES: isoleucine--tRNA ligase [Mucilaginibacter]QEM06559.1 isoleucine--tRNA ligase [Mucilaginibacter rubeus]QEM19148.1 isoleucine--tRNA ligase [Mucilaginibacter gossypii]QTE44309.1 isoleucine--tRNA ligase [Mucilaginibacter rubeus]QTE50909.1 isoleucine--tRNA ligase [Mucilaginibacter rubeus]QTE55992.1 isoleucine--tRNA ligase [Mucilaginibacter rubeus]
MYKEYKQLNLSQTGKEILDFWKQKNIFEKSITSRPAGSPYTFYEGPPSANGMPGIHHVMSRSIKDIFCRYKTLKGYQVKRKGGWDTHGLPIELAVEKALGITKDDIGKKISVKDYNDACRKEVMRYTDVWNDLTEKMGYWVDLNDPYITYKNEYIESLWWILKQLHNKDLLYKGYTVQPYSPKSGTGLSSHELNQPGTYKMVKDTTITAQFKVKRDSDSEFLFNGIDTDIFILAWTTTPWTLPSNCALAVGEEITYAKISTFNPYTYLPVCVVLAKDLIKKYFKAEGENASFADYKGGDKIIPWKIEAEVKGSQLVGIHYEQLMPYVTNEDLEKNAFRVIPADFVTTEDGTGIVHTASVFGADDFRACKENNVPSVMVKDETGKDVPLVNKQGRFVDEVTDYAGRYVKEEYYTDAERAEEGFKPTDVLISIKLKTENRAFDVKKYEHSYPHSWRSDEPILYYPLDSWFIRTTAVKDKMVELNKTINWKPESTGTGRFGNWLENLVDWNLSRSRYWGTPLPIWREENGTEEICIGSIAELNAEIAKSIKAGFMPEGFVLEDMHRPYVDDVVLVSSTGNKMLREPDLIDVWFDSGAMPYAQWHFPFEGQEEFKNAYPADFIAEGVDQTRGWFFTLHAIAVMLSEASDEVKAINEQVGNKGIAFKNVVSNGLVLDKNGNKMSKRLGNAADPFETIEKYGADAARWYMISNASPWDNLKFNEEGIDEVRRKFFGTLYNTYSFFTLYANIDKFTYSEPEIENRKRPEIDRWIISLLNTLSKEVDGYYADFEPTKAARAIQEFVDVHFSNWFIRLSRRRFWKSDNTEDKLSAYQTLYTCLISISKLMSPIAPFFADRLYCDLNAVTRKEEFESVHLAYFPEYNSALVDAELEERMQLAQDVSSLTLSLRKKVNINVRQPLSKILLPILDKSFKLHVEQVKDLILSETNIKDIEYIIDTAGFIKKKIKPNFKALGQKVGKDMKVVAEAITNFSQDDIAALEANGNIPVLDGKYEVLATDVEIIAEDVPGWQVANLGKLTVALDVTITNELKQEGISREFINRVQNIRKTKGFEVTDRINVQVSSTPAIREAVENNLSYICAEILADSITFVDNLTGGEPVTIDEQEILIAISKV